MQDQLWCDSSIDKLAYTEVIVVILLVEPLTMDLSYYEFRIPFQIHVVQYLSCVCRGCTI